MPRLHERFPTRPILLALCAAALTACGDPFALPPAGLATSERDVVLHALTNTDVVFPSAFSVINSIEVRTDRSPDFDFAVDIGPDSAFGLGVTGDTVVAIFPRGGLGFSADGGVQLSTVPWDSLVLAPGDGYSGSLPIRVTLNDIVVVSSRTQTCNFGLLRHLYAKFRVDAIDLVERSVTLRMVIDPNCGYRGLGAGIPAN